jgi:hypothetical protein
MVNKYLKFDGIDGVVTVSDNDALDFGTGDFSICFWANKFSANCELFYKDDNVPYYKCDISTGSLSFTYRASDSLQSLSRTVPADGWHHIAITIDRNGNGYIYIDANAGTLTTITGGQETLSNNTDLIIASGNYSGSLDDLRIYKKALTAAEVLTIYNAGTPKVYTVLDTPTSGAASAAWNMNEGFGTTITDEIQGLVGTFSATGVTWQPAAASTPILESIAENIKTIVAGITIANGYQQDLVCLRPKRAFFLDAVTQDNTVILAQDAPAKVDASAFGCQEWIQPFSLVAILMDSDAATTPIDTRLNQVRSDIEKAILADTTHGGLAIDTIIEPPAYFAENQMTGIEVKINVHYRTKYDDPYTQI